MFTHWKLKDFAPDQGVLSAVVADQPPTNDWIDINVPGDVHTALIAAGRIADPFYDKNELDCKWVEEREWWYRTTFTAPATLQPDERLLLAFKGVDTFATFYLNGTELGRSANMFHEVVFDVSQKLLPAQENSLVVCFHPPLKVVEGKPAPVLTPASPGEDTPKVLMRKAQFGYGWDWGPRLPTIGLWRPVELLRQRRAAIDSLHFFTESITDASAQVSLQLDIDNFVGHGDLHVDVALYDASHVEVARRRLAVPAQGTHLHTMASLVVDKPHLWWTHDLGDPYLYTLEVTLQQAGEELDRRSASVGIRTIVLDQSPDPDELGTRFFRFVLNGVPIFAKGANWIPADSFVGAIPDERYERWITAAQQANMNMLRVWGGGIYEHDSFYDRCDRFGLLVWQAFMFACAAYPDDDPAFVEEVRQEAEYQVRRLRSHPCLAVWVGNNECQVIDTMMKQLTGSTTPLPGDLFYDKMLPEICSALNPEIAYWPGSPYGGKHPNDQAQGDVHDWTVWHGISEDANLMELFTKGPTPEQVTYTRYAEDRGRFISEFGMHASPVLETLRRVVPQDQIYHHSPSMDHHNKDNPKNKGDLLMMTSTGLPTDLPSYVDFSMIAQAEGLKFGIEHFRRRKPHCSGTLIWQLNDCWPVLSWAIMDYYGFGKAGYYYTRRVFSPVLASFKALKEGGVELWITNDTLQAFKDTVTLQYGDFATGKLWEEILSVSTPSNSSQAMWSAAPDRIAPRPDAYLSVRSASGAFPANRHFFVAIKDLQRRKGEPTVNVTAVNDHELRVHVAASSHVYFFHLIVPEEHTHYSDNYFDLFPGESVDIVVTNPNAVLTSDLLTFDWL